MNQSLINLERGDFVHLINPNNRRIDSGAIENIEGNRVIINSAVYRQKTLYLIYSHHLCAYFFQSEDGDSNYFENGICINPNYPFHLEKDDSRLPIIKTS